MACWSTRPIATRCSAGPGSSPAPTPESLDARLSAIAGHVRAAVDWPRIRSPRLTPTCTRIADVFVNRMARYEVLSEDALEHIDRGWRRLVTEVGIEFLHPEALRCSGGRAGSGGSRVSSTPTSCWNRPRSRRATFTLRGRKPSADFPWAANLDGLQAGSGPAVRAPGCERRDGTRRLLALRRISRRASTTSTPPAASPCEPNDRPLDSRHLDMQLSLMS